MRADTDDNGMVLRVTEVVADRGSNFHPRPSPDGQLLAFDSDRDGERGIYVADSNGRNVRRVSGPGFATVPSWSPDGRRLAFVRAEPGKPRVWNIWTVDMAGGTPARVTRHPVRPALGSRMVSRRGSHRLQPRGSAHHPHAAGEGTSCFQVSGPRTSGADPRRLAGRQANHFPGPPRRRVDPRPGDRVHVSSAGGPFC